MTACHSSQIVRNASQTKGIAMSVIILPLRFVCVGLLLALIADVRADDEKTAEGLDAKTVAAEFDKVREILASVDELPATKARWVKVQVGQAKDKSWLQGWLVFENAGT